MTNKIENFLEISKELEGQLLEKGMLISKLGSISHDVALEYSDALGSYIDELIVFKSIISASDQPHILNHLVDGLNESQLSKLSTIITNLPFYECETNMAKIVNATLGIHIPTNESQRKANELILLIKTLNVDHEKKAKELADFLRMVKTLCDLLIVCRMGEHVESYMRDRLSMIPENDLNWLLEIGFKRLTS